MNVSQDMSMEPDQCPDECDKYQQELLLGQVQSGPSPEIDDIFGGSRHESLSTGSGRGSDETQDPEEQRKAKNRASQRAFRERKELKVKELEKKLVDKQGEVEELKRKIDGLTKENAILSSENKLLRQSAVSQASKLHRTGSSVASKVTFPDHKFYETVLRSNESPSHTVYQTQTGQTRVGAAAVWKMLVEQSDMDDYDFEYVTSILKGKTVCDGNGPAFSLTDVQQAIQQAKQRKWSGTR